MSLLFSPLKIGNIVAKNRIVISPMCQYSCEDGFASDWHLVHLGARAVGGAGIVMMEATAVEDIGRITPFCPGIWKDEHIPQLKRVTDFIKSQNSIPAIQIGHAGRRACTYQAWVKTNKHVPIEEGGWQSVAPSPIPFDAETDPVPKELTLSDIARIKQAFVDGALRAVKAGFQLIELHYAHGYLMQTFLSPNSNKRTDQYGGSFENRIRLSLEIIQEIQAAVPKDFPLIVRLSCDDYRPKGEGWDLSHSIELAKRFKAIGVALVDCSSGENVRSNRTSHHNNVDQVAFAEAIQREANIPTGAVGGIISPKWAEKILQENKATLVFIARASLDDPNWPLHAAWELNDQAQFQVPNPYSWAIGEQTSGKWRQTSLVERNRKQLEQQNAGA